MSTSSTAAQGADNGVVKFNYKSETVYAVPTETDDFAGLYTVKTSRLLFCYAQGEGLELSALLGADHEAIDSAKAPKAVRAQIGGGVPQ